MTLYEEKQTHTEQRDQLALRVKDLKRQDGETGSIPIGSVLEVVDFSLLQQKRWTKL